ncbi:MAG: alcohol dehydrogenase [Calditrichaeota bacterium]|nr:MAG: alcohol dehydrogenase [Calditrichota bacterium]
MKALTFDGKELKLTEIPKPVPTENEVLIKVAKAGICNTDHEIIKGYIPNFNGILGHEFFGYVKEAQDKNLIGKRVSGEINLACGTCEFCEKGLGRHCPNRSVFGIINRNGAFSEYVTLPKENVIEIPSEIPDERAVFIEPLAAACEILEQVKILPNHEVLLIGDGKLALLIARVLHSTGCKLKVLGKHQDKLETLGEVGISTVLLENFTPKTFDVVVEASGNSTAFELGLSCTKPRGTFVLKSTYAGGINFNPALVVVNEITMIGSRCGRFEDAVKFLQNHKPTLEKMIHSEFEFSKALEAFENSAQRNTLKVILNF